MTQSKIVNLEVTNNSMNSDTQVLLRKRFAKPLVLEYTNDGVPDAELMKKLLSRAYYERANNKKWPA